MRVPERDAGLVATRGGDGDTAKRAIVAMKAALQRNAKAKTAKLARDKAQGKETPADDAPKKTFTDEEAVACSRLNSLWPRTRHVYGFPNLVVGLGLLSCSCRVGLVRYNILTQPITI